MKTLLTIILLVVLSGCESTPSKAYNPVIDPTLTLSEQRKAARQYARNPHKKEVYIRVTEVNGVPLTKREQYIQDNLGNDFSYAANNPSSGSLGDLLFGQTEYKNTSNLGRLNKLAAEGSEQAKRELLGMEYDKANK